MLARFLLILLTLQACGGNPGAAGPLTATVRFVLLAPTNPTLPDSVAACVAEVGPTHIHPSWHGFELIPMSVAGPDRYELSLSDVPILRDLSIRVSDKNACLENATGAATRNVFANDVLLTRVVPTPGSGVEPGLAFRVDAQGRVTP